MIKAIFLCVKKDGYLLFTRVGVRNEYKRGF